MRAPMKTQDVIARRIARLNREFAAVRQAGGDVSPYLRRARALSAAWLAERRRQEGERGWE